MKTEEPQVDPSEVFAVAAKLPEPMLLVTADGDILDANPAAAALLERPASALRQLGLLGLAGSTDGEVREYLRACSRTGQLLLGSLALRAGKQGVLPLRCEGAVVRPRADGMPAWILLRFKTRQSAAGRFHLLNQKIAELAREVGERQRAQEALRESERFARSTVDALSAHLAILDESGIILAVNRAWREFGAANGADLERIGPGVNYLAVCGKARGATTAAQFADGIRDVTAGICDKFTLEYACHSPERRRWYLGRVSRFPGSGRARVVVAHEDVSDRKRAELLLRGQRRILEWIVRGEPLAETLDLVVRLVEEQSPTQPTASILLLDRETGRLHDGASPHLPSEYVAALEGMEIGPEVGSCGTAAHSRRMVVVTDIANDPLWRDYRDLALAHGLAACWSTPIFDSAGEVLGTFALYHRQSRGPEPEEMEVVGVLSRTVAIAIERERTERERAALLAGEQEARLDAEAANRAKDEFLATVSHELRTPLNAILGWAEVLRSGHLDPERTRRAIETIERNARTQAQLIGDILDYSRIISGQLKLEVGPVDLARVIESALDVVRPAAESKELFFKVRFEAGAEVITGDPDRLQQVCWNLLANAVKFTPKGGEVEVELTRQGSQAVLEVRDTGQGIRPDFLPYIFDRFRQEDSRMTRRYGGLGLGLAIVRHLVELHGGSIEAESDGEGRGAIFRVLLPVRAIRTPVATVEDRPAAPAPEPRPRAELPRLDGVRVVVVEDDVDSRELMTLVLERAGAEVAAAASAAGGLESLERLRPDVLVSDIEMPGEDGYQLIRKVRALGREQGGDLPAVALTAHARDEDRQRAQQAGYQHHLSKPVAAEDLLATLARLTGRL